MKQTIGLLMMVGLMVGVVGCGDDDSSPTSSSVSQDKYSVTAKAVGPTLSKGGNVFYIIMSYFVSYIEGFYVHPHRVQLNQI